MPASANAFTSSTSKSFQTFGDAVGQVVVMQEVAKRLRRGRKAGRHPHAGFGELADHLAKRRILAADNVDIGHPQLLEWHYIRLVLCNVSFVSHVSP